MNHKKILFPILLAILIIAALYGLVIVNEYVGYATQTHEGEAGNIYSLVMRYSIPIEEWAGIYGVAVRVPGYTNQQSELLEGGGTEETNLLFECLAPDKDNEVYASLAAPAEIDFGNVQAATPAEVDNYLGKDSSDLDSAANTFTQTAQIKVGNQVITAPAVYTYKQSTGSQSSFVTALLKDSNDNLIYASILTNFTEGFNGRVYNYQMLLPTALNETEEYYFYTDPTDVCPAGDGEEEPDGLLTGVVTDTGGNPLEDVIIDVASTTTASGADGSYNMTPNIGSHNIYAIKEGYEVYQNNVSIAQNETTTHDITLVDLPEDNPFTGVGTGDGIGPGEDEPGDSTQTGEGPGEIPPVPFVEEPAQIEGTDYVISMNELKRKIRPNEFIQERIHIFNFRDGSVTATFEVQGNASELIELDNEQLTVEPDSNEEMLLTIFGREQEGLYNGTLVIDGDINATIPIEIEVVAEDKLPIESLSLDIESSRKEYLPGQGLKFKTDLRNLLIEDSYAVELLFTIQHAETGETIWTQTSSTYLRTAFSMIKTAQLPDQLEPGDYVLRATARYLGISSGASTIFSIEVPFWQQIFLGLRFWHWGLIIGAILTIAGGGFWYWRKQQARKKFHLKVEMSELPQPGTRSIYVGKIAETDHKTYFNLEQFKTHTIVAGSTGGGKSVSAQVIIEEALDKGVAVIAFDPTAQWTGMLRPCKDKTMLSLYPIFGMKKTDAKAFGGNVRMILDPREKIDIEKYVTPGEIQVFCFHKLNPKDMDIVVANAIRSIFKSGPDENKALKTMFVFDEVHRLLPKFGGSGDGFLQIERACREFRKWGLGVMLISQVLSDFVGTIKANINTEIQMRTRDEGDLERIRQKYGEDVLRSLVKATVGSGMVENPAYNLGKPYFVAFKPLKHSVERMGDEEIQQYNDYNDKMDDLFYSLDQLEEEDVDVFDLRLELKLALDKVKAGNFNMVDVYLEGLTPRIDKQWEKLGKKPKKFERELVDLKDIKADVAKAQEDRDEAESKESSKQEPEEKKEIGWTDDVPPDNILNLTNGMIVISLSSLYDEVSAMKEEDFAQHVVEGEKNDFAEWVLNAVGDKKLSYALYNESEQQKILELLEKKKNEEELPDATLPGWAKGGSEEKKESSENEKPQASGAEESSGESGPEEKKGPEQEGGEKEPAQASAGGEGSEKKEVPDEKSHEQPKEEKPAEENDDSKPAKEEEPEQKPAQEEKPAEKKDSIEDYTKEPEEEHKGSYDNLVASPSEAFKFENGKAITGVKELRNYLHEMPEDLFKNHVSNEYNHFADWVQGVFHEEGLAQKMREAHTRDELETILAG